MPWNSPGYGLRKLLTLGNIDSNEFYQNAKVRKESTQASGG
jgi:hypothetical protein